MACFNFCYINLVALIINFRKLFSSFIYSIQVYTLKFPVELKSRTCQPASFIHATALFQISLLQSTLQIQSRCKRVKMKLSKMVSSVVQHSLQNGSLLSHFLSMQEVKPYRNKCINIKISPALCNH